MLTRVREAETGSGFVIKVFGADGDIEERETEDLADAFTMQKSVQDTGKWPDGKEPGE